MLQRSHRRRIVLFLVAIVVPSLVLVVLSLRMIGQERELTEKRLLDEQHRRVNEIRQDRGEIANNRAELKSDVKELKADKQGRRQDRREFRRDVKDALKN